MSGGVVLAASGAVLPVPGLPEGGRAGAPTLFLVPRRTMGRGPGRAGAPSLSLGARGRAGAGRAGAPALSLDARRRAVSRGVSM